MNLTVTMTTPRRVIVVHRYLAGYGWIACEEDCGGPPEHVGTGRTVQDAIVDLFAWFGEESDLSDVVVIEESCR
jgi:hypothetical protein